MYQSVIQLSYADKLLPEVQIRFRDLYKNVLADSRTLTTEPKLFNGFTSEFNKILGEVKTVTITNEPKKPRTFEQSEKSKKTVASMIETAADRAKAQKEKEKEKTKGKDKKLVFYYNKCISNGEPRGARRNLNANSLCFHENKIFLIFARQKVRVS